MKSLRFSVWEQSTQRYDADFTEKEYTDYLNWLHRNAESEATYNHRFATEACKVFDTLNFQDIVDIMTGDKDDISFPSGWEHYTTSVQDCIQEYVNDYIYDCVPEYLESEQIDDEITVVEENDD